MDVPETITEVALPDPEALTKACRRCQHPAVVHQPSNGSCLTCDLVGGSCAPVRPVESTEPVVPAFARATDYEIDGTDEIRIPEAEIWLEGWRADLHSVRVDDDGQPVIEEQPGRLSSFIETEMSRLFALQSERVLTGALLKNIGAYDLPREPTKTELDRAYLGDRVRALMAHPTAHGASGHGKSKGGSKKKKGGGANDNWVGTGIGPNLPDGTKRLTVAVTSGEFAYYSSTDEERAVLVSGAVSFLKGELPPPSAVGKTSENLVIYLDKRIHDLFRMIPGLAHSYLQSYAVIKGRHRYRALGE